MLAVRLHLDDCDSVLETPNNAPERTMLIVKIRRKKTTTPKALSLRERILYHQIHPLKLAVDIAASVASTWLLWQHESLLRILAAFLPPVVVSVVMLWWMGFERQRDSGFGRYVSYHMTHIAEAVRFAGQVAVWIGAWFHLGWLIALGIALVLLGWTYSLPW